MKQKKPLASLRTLLLANIATHQPPYLYYAAATVAAQSGVVSLDDAETACRQLVHEGLVRRDQFNLVERAAHGPS